MVLIKADSFGNPLFFYRLIRLLPEPKRATMKHFGFITALVLIAISSSAQSITDQIDKIVVKHDASAHLSFLAADEMRGRDAGSNELDIAANYIRTQFRINNIPPLPGTDDYFQYVDLSKYLPPTGGSATIGKEQFTLNQSMLVLGGTSNNWTGDFVYVGYGSEEELKKKDIKGKMVLALAGSKDTDNINKVYMASRDKYAMVQKMGAAGLVEILALPQVPWPALVNFFHNVKWTLRQGESIPFVWVKSKNPGDLALNESKKISGKVSVTSPAPQSFAGKNVAALVEGTDPVLKNEYVILTAHYDHVGVTREPDQPDSIFNGARDNALGTVALLQTARFLAQHPSKRSVVIMAVTCEEKGLLGSSWYAKHPIVPLEKTVLNLNCDGVGYNDKTRVTSISLGRTNVDDLVTQAAKAYNFTVGGDPDPSEGFYDRSDQVSFAKEGVPAIKLQPGLSKMDESIFKNYHRPSDEFSTLDMDYLTQFYRTFVYTVHLLSNDSRKPAWTPGDKYEQAGKKLYGGGK